MSEPRFRLLRVLEYEGTLEQLQNFILDRSVKGSYTVPNGAIIRESIIGETADVLLMDTPIKFRTGRLDEEKVK